MPSENNNANQIIVNGEEVINLRNDTVSSENLLQGETAHNKAGEQITGDLDPATKDDAYLVSDVEDEIADDDYIPFNDVSDPDIIKKKTLFSSIVTKIKTAFNSVFASITGNNIAEKKTFRENIQTIEFLGVDIPDNADLDTYTTAGNYRVVSDASGETIDNLPLALCGKVVVFDNGNGGIEQFYFANHSPRIFVRTKFGTDAWTNWIEIGSGGDSKAHTYERGTPIPENSDLDTYLTQGVYFIGSDVASQTISNVPVQHAGKLIVVESINNTNYRIQMYQMLTGEMWVRYYSLNESGWQNWKEIASTDDISSGGFAVGTISGTAITATITGFTLKTGVIVMIRLETGGMPIGATLNINNTGAKSVKWHWNNDIRLRDIPNMGGATWTLMYDGTYYRVIAVNNSPSLALENYVANTSGYIKQINGIDQNAFQFFYDVGNNNLSWQFYNNSAWSSRYKISDERNTIVEIGRAIPANSDLNSYNNTKIGVWYCELTATAQTISNVPYSVAFKLIVMYVRNTSSNIMQLFIPYDDLHDMYWRTTDNNGTSWQRWRTIGEDVLNARVAKNIASGNLNTYTTEGTYYWSAGSTSDITNLPFNDAGYMWVMWVYDTVYIRQVAFHRANNNILTRISTDSGSTWTSWGLLYNSVTNSPVTASQIQTGTDTTVRTVRADTLHNGILDTMASATQGVKRVSKIKVFHFSVPDNSGYYKWVKIFDVTEWYNSTTTNQSTRSMSGFVFSDRDNGYMKQEYAWIDLGVAYEKVASQNAGALNLLTTNSNYKPQIIYESSTSKYFLCIRVTGAGRHLEFIGTMYDLTSYNTNLINEWILGTSDNQLPSGYSVAIDGSTHQERSCYGVCYTASDQRIKTVDLADPIFKLEVGVMVGVRFMHTNTYSSTTANPIQLNVNNTGAKNIWYSSSHTGSVSTGTNTNVYGYADRIIYYMYDGTYWVWMGSSVEIDTNDHINSRGNVTAETSTTRPAVSGLSMSQAYNNGYPQSYGNVMTMKGTGDSQLFIPWSGTSGKAEPLYFRSKRDNTSAEWSNWDMVFSKFYSPLGYGWCSTAEATTAKTVTISNFTWQAGSIVVVGFDYAVPANSTLNINNIGARPIYYHGEAIKAGIIKSGDRGLFIYHNSNLILVTTDRSIGLFANYRYADSAGTPSTTYVTINDSSIQITEFSIVRRGDTVMLAMCVKYSTSKTYSTGTKIATLCYSTAQTLYPHDRFFLMGSGIYARAQTFSGNYYLQCTFIVY